MKPKHALPHFRSNLRTAILIAAVSAAGAAAACPCSNETLCFSITSSPRKEVLAFYIGSDAWPTFDWQSITTLAVYLPVADDLYCVAHAAGVRVVAIVEYDGNLGNAAAVAAWTSSIAVAVNKSHLDGVRQPRCRA